MSKKQIIELLAEDVQLKIQELSLVDNEILATALIFAMAEVEAANMYGSTGEFNTPEKAHDLLTSASEAALVMVNTLIETIESQQEVKH
jgi:hypothetical protein